MSLEFNPVHNEAQIKQVVDMADVIWHEYWPDLIGKAQTDYMVDMFQSFSALFQDIQEKDYKYWTLTHEEHLVGYTGGHIEEEKNRFFISKIYLFKDERGKGYASEVIDFYKDQCQLHKLNSMYLTVNKNNELALRAYRAKNFKVIEESLFDIGGGFFMDDYIMEKSI